MSTAIVWFRRDLRVHDHPALSIAAREYERVIPLFVFDQALLRGRFASSARTAFMLGCLHELDRELRFRGGRLIVRAGEPAQTVAAVAGEVGADAVLWSRDVAPYATSRDERVTSALSSVGVQTRPQPGNYVVEPAELQTETGGGYRVFSPYSRRWQRVPRRAIESAPAALAVPEGLGSRGPEEIASQLGLPNAPLERPVVEPGERSARRAAGIWFQDGLARYAERNNGVSRLGSSRLSAYLRWGCLSPTELEHRARARGGTGATAWIRQLAWRDFYAHVLFNWPENLHLEFQEKMRVLEREGPQSHLASWQRGETGYPIVDAGMRQLARTGWIHNRVRLAVGSFLTKDLHIDWREGERWFERWLLDGEPAQNNGNWQWIASVGTDPAPAFRRIYNPTLQARSFDPDGTYLRRWIPELARVPDEKLFEPWTMTPGEQRSAGCTIGRDYPEPVVDHAAERRRALELYKTAAAPVPSRG